MKRLPIYAAALLTTSLVTAAERPNVVIIYADDMGYGDLNVNNTESKIPTPQLDKLASEGMRFTDGHSSSGICTPSRFALLTGQHHWRRFHNIVNAFGPSVFKPGEYTLPRMFREKGYNTACVGKWHLGWDWRSLRTAEAPKRYTPERQPEPQDFDWSKPVPNGPTAQGFDYYFGDGTINFPPYCWVENDCVVEAPTEIMKTKLFGPIPEGRWEFRDGPMVKGWDPYKVLPTVTDKAVAWIEKQDENKPFFLYFPLPSPHAPIIPNKAYHGKSEAGPYGDFVYETDAMAGRILDTLEKKGFSDNTIVIFTADNGSEKYAYDRAKKYDHWSSGHFRGLKRDVWEGGHRVPFVIKWPGKVKAGTVSNQTVSQVDLAATLASVIGYDLKSNQAIDSYNLLPLVSGASSDKQIRKATVQNTFRKVYSIRQGDWVYIDAPSGEHTGCPGWFAKEKSYTKDSTPGLLYNLAKDPAQHNNLYAENPERVQNMKTLLDTYRGGQGCAPHAK